jgi:pimeloyl-ACP methyl ester carboxylesterase
MQTVTSADGTTIAIERFSDAGPGLVKIGGAFCDRSFAAPLTAALSDRFSVYGYDRRGRGDTGPGASAWSVGRELEDVGAVLDAIAPAGPVSVYGHSSGAAIALEAAAAGAPIHRLAVYEPPYTGTAGSTLRRAAELQSLVDEGRLDEAAALFLAGTGMPVEQIERMRRRDGWPGMVARAGTLGYDVGSCNDGVVPMDRLRAIGCPLLASAGDASPAWAVTAVQAIADAVPGARAEVLASQDHNPAPEALAPPLTEFLRGLGSAG